MIVTSRHRRKRPKSAQPVEITAPRIVQHTPKGRAWQLQKLERDPEGEARVIAFFRRMGLNVPDDIFEP